MILSHAFGMLFRPETEWAAIKKEKPTPMVVYGLYILVLALIGPVSAYIGTVETGWTIGERLIKLTPDSAMQLVILTYLAILAGSFALGYGINWMATTFGAETEKNGNNSLALVAYSLTPMYIAGLTLLYPDPWGNAMILLAAASYGAWLMWKGVPVVMGMSKEQSMVYCGGILTLALVLLVSTLATTGLLWNFGFGPTFIEAGL
ncbi:MAG: Yip1 family protein [Halospina sp.]